MRPPDPDNDNDDPSVILGRRIARILGPVLVAALAAYLWIVYLAPPS